ncbi:MAG: hypothetical protein H8D92_01365 [Pelagibacteraceae bacterium]|jgi:hypothetical protein|nr:hypothetical protein [Pelagibacteraceae bacterium]
MYSDDKTWKQHYNEWVHIVKRLKSEKPKDISIQQHEYRIKLIRELAEKYEVDHNE